MIHTYKDSKRCEVLYMHAVQWNGTNEIEVENFVDLLSTEKNVKIGAIDIDTTESNNIMTIPYIHNDMKTDTLNLNVGDWLINYENALDELYVFSDDEFEQMLVNNFVKLK